MILNRENAVIELKDQTIKEYGGIEFQEIAFAQKINLRGNSSNKSFMTLQGKLLDAVLPTKSNTYTNNGKIKILWLGPNEWLIVDEDKKNNELFLKLEKSDSHEESAITDVSENRTIIRIRGKKIFNLLAKFLVIDLDKNLSNDSSVVQTLFVKVPIILVRNNSNVVEIDLYVNRSHANYVYNLLVDGTKNLDF